MVFTFYKVGNVLKLMMKRKIDLQSKSILSVPASKCVKLHLFADKSLFLLTGADLWARSWMLKVRAAIQQTLAEIYSRYSVQKADYTSTVFM